jgi:hypothetical protein
MFRPYWAIFRQHTIINEMYCTVSLSTVFLQIGYYYYRILFHLIVFVLGFTVFY